ncbi:MAG TPA: flagellar filament outer layer protein FlaA [Spirochaetota bacterium]|nr:flagellar filament outer layer protein FlaA [Spirochaetota bacterium]HPH02224.1 flagellar filament outer layer protein FlaA [Spirochaetota bacterium]
MRKATRIAGIVLLAVCMFLMTLAYAQTVDATGSQSGRLVANRAFVIDFGQYESRMKAQIERNKKLIESRTNASAARGLPTEKFTMEASDWALDKWEVELNSSASSIMNNVLSYVVKVGSPWWLNNAKRIYSGMAGKLEGYNETPASNVLGVRIHFPTHRQNCWAKIHPPFEINAYDDKGGLANTNNGIVDNVGQIKSISVWVKGRNYDNGFAIRLKDREGIEREYYLGSLLFDNWRELTWVNPNYIENPKDRILQRLPLYPRSRPYIKFTSFVVYRQMDSVGGDFVLYIRDVKMAYDKAIPDDIDKDDFQDENIWGILSKAREEEKERELLRLAERKTLLKQEESKLLIETNKRP